MKPEIDEAFDNGFNDGFNNGFNNGFNDERLRIVRKKLKKHKTTEQIAEALELTVNEVKGLISQIKQENKENEKDEENKARKLS